MAGGAEVGAPYPSFARFPASIQSMVGQRSASRQSTGNTCPAGLLFGQVVHPPSGISNDQWQRPSTSAPLGPGQRALIQWQVRPGGGDGGPVGHVVLRWVRVAAASS